MEPQTLPVVTFGKYKGQPVTSLLADVPYLEWCKQQAWFSKCTTVYNICVNQTITQTDSKTPQHNKLQNLFLDRRFNIELINKIYGLDKTVVFLNSLFESEEYKKYFGDQRFNTNDYGLEKSMIKTEFETIFNWDVCLLLGVYVRGKGSYSSNGNRILLEPKYNNQVRDINKHLFMNSSNIETWEGKTVHYTFADCVSTLYIEIKPLLGDDYPNVLRKMNTQIKLTNDSDGRYILLIGEYASSTTSKEQLIQIFKQSKIRVVFTDDLSIELPCKPIEDVVVQLQDTKLMKLEQENKVLREKLLRTEEELLKMQKPTKTMKDYYGKK
jgi:hypothetical protein